MIGLNFISCSRLTNSGFWLRYKSDQIIEQKNDQGPWGGILAINWKAEMNANFKISELKKIAEENDWKLIDSISINATELNNMTELGEPIIRVPLKNFEPNAKNADYKSEPLPRWINTNSKLYRFKTNRLIFESGTDDSTNENGFILLSENGTEMSLYQIWGE